MSRSLGKAFFPLALTILAGCATLHFSPEEQRKLDRGANACRLAGLSSICYETIASDELRALYPKIGIEMMAIRDAAIIHIDMLNRRDRAELESAAASRALGRSLMDAGDELQRKAQQPPAQRRIGFTDCTPTIGGGMSCISQ